MALASLSSRPHILIVGCGIIGATLAYELSLTQQFRVTVVDANNQRFIPSGPISAQKFSSSTGAALGVLMGVISRKKKGRAWEMRRQSIQRYETLIPELEAATGMRIMHNRQGLLRICFDDESMESWEELVSHRHHQGFRLQILGRDTLMRTYPQLRIDTHCDRPSPSVPTLYHAVDDHAADDDAVDAPEMDSKPKVTGAIYSPEDLQVNPVSLVMVLIEAAILQGVTFQWGCTVKEWGSRSQGDRLRVHTVKTSRDAIDCDGVIITAGLGSTALADQLGYALPQKAVLGQAVHLKLPQPLSLTEPVIIGRDTNIVPLDKGHYWVGATVEFPDGDGEAIACKDTLTEMLQGVYDLYPRLRDGDILRTWAGTRPRPNNRPAPVIEALADYSNVILATAHYRNGVLLAPATAEKVRRLIRELAIA